MLHDLLAAGAAVFTFNVLIAIAIGMFVGLVIGAIPGLTITMGMALLSPFTFFVEPVLGISFLIGLYKGGTFGGTISAVLIGTPGTASNAAVMEDGFALKNQGKAGIALHGGLLGALVGDFAGSIALVFMAPALASVAIHFGPQEFFALVLFSLTMVCYVSGTSLTKGLIAAGFGLFLSLIGTDPIGGTQRLTFGISDLSSGIETIAIVTGLFGIAEVLIQMEKFGRGETGQPPPISSIGSIHIPFRDFISRWATILRSSMIGTFIGILPGIGAETSTWVSYGVAKRLSKHPERFGKGELDGVIAPEAASNAECGAAMIPMMVFGIPGDIVTAILMSAFIAQGLQPGPFLLTEHRETIYSLFLSVLVSTVFLYVVGRATMPWWGKILSIPTPLLYGMVVIFCIVGTYSIHSNVFDIYVMLAFGVIGYFMRKFGIAIAPMILTFILSTILEESLRRGLVQSGGSILSFAERPIAAFFFALTVVVLFSFAWSEIRSRRAGKMLVEAQESF
jgi:putative tricarboxylic transport membrane protein